MVLEISLLKGVGIKKKYALNCAEIFECQDLWNYLPFRYEDRTVFHHFDQLKVGEIAHVVGTVVEIEHFKHPKERLIVDVKISKGFIQLVYFQGISFWKNKFTAGTKLRIWGKVQFFTHFQIAHPKLDFLKPSEVPKGDILPVYSLKEEMVEQRIDHLFLQKIILQAIELSNSDHFSEELRNHLSIHSQKEMFLQLHKPSSLKKAEQAYQELFIREWFITCLDLEKVKYEKTQIGYAFPTSNRYKPKVLADLPFEVTKDQLKAIDQIEKGLASSQQYYGLLNGDVGSGKTLVVLIVALSVVESKKQVALIVPTEILARQHLNSFKSFLNSTEIKVALLVGSLSKKERDAQEEAILNKEIDIIIGTHALFSESVSYGELGMVVFDEQHRYGVKQKELLIQKSKHPDVLQLTATPIPQSLVQVFYNDIDYLVMKQTPYQKVIRKTRLVFPHKRQDLLQFLWERSQNQESFFWILPRINKTFEDNQKQVPTVQSILTELQSFQPKWRLSGFHGKMNVEEQQKVFNDVQKKQIQGLIATTVVEVGLDLPFLNFIVIEAPEYFGLSQLHQLRGRIGRRGGESWCFLVFSESTSQEARDRLEKFVALNDGFAIAELDLSLRGPGQLNGEEQSGFGKFKLLTVKQQMNCILELRKKAKTWLQKK